ncbi:hypothetical protein [Burkholderia ubonensis]|uniref:hypothetical protein n=1 Tax=Burkholderia ubonensis TaxID=101571 RepID=UPI000754B3C8|nr:hypothetical protein [Burkholderia ubonensis]KVP16866.1 hypothetical protein WJ84_00910 [Burkholderia ubonensis]KVP40009.1 hypothetical protein WJ87_07455 [Burkholderia ubonensis]
MRPDLLTYVKALSLADKKTITQKVLKLMEEAGELAKAALPFDNAYATNHRFVTRQKMLEEAVDSMLVSLSVIYSLGFDDQDMEHMLKKKADYWAELQAREDLLADKMPKGTPYELHLTVAEAPDVDAFRLACHDAEVKPILLDLQTRGNDVIKDVMTSSVVFGTNTDALAALDAQTKVLEAHGLQVVRKKIETVPWHPAAPSLTHAVPVMPKDCYFECHFGVKTQDGPQMSELRALAKNLGCHMSRNTFKRTHDHAVVMLTYRDYEGPYEKVTAEVEHIGASLRAAGYEVDKEIVEFSLYDTKVHHDAAWLAAA